MSFIAIHAMRATCTAPIWRGRGNAAAVGLSAGEIRAEARDLAKKGSAKRQHEYAERTAGKAVRQAE